MPYRILASGIIETDTAEEALAIAEAITKDAGNTTDLMIDYYAVTGKEICYKDEGKKNPYLTNQTVVYAWGNMSHDNLIEEAYKKIGKDTLSIIDPELVVVPLLKRNGRFVIEFTFDNDDVGYLEPILD